MYFKNRNSNLIAKCIFYYFGFAKNYYVVLFYSYSNNFFSNLFYFFYFCLRELNLFLIFSITIVFEIVLDPYTFFNTYIQAFFSIFYNIYHKLE